MTDPKPKARNVSATIPPELADWLKEQAAREQRTVGVVITRSLQTYRQACEANGMDEGSRAAMLPVGIATPTVTLPEGVDGEEVASMIMAALRAREVEAR